jgi:hypothetical protein
MSKIKFKQFTDSSVIHSSAWDEDTQGLIIIFHSGAIWHYDSISYENFVEFISAPSVGAYFNSKIRNKLNGTCIYKKGETFGKEQKKV